MHFGTQWRKKRWTPFLVIPQQFGNTHAESLNFEKFLSQNIISIKCKEHRCICCCCRLCFNLLKFLIILKDQPFLWFNFEIKVLLELLKAIVITLKIFHFQQKLLLLNWEISIWWHISSITCQIIVLTYQIFNMSRCQIFMLICQIFMHSFVRK